MGKQFITDAMIPLIEESLTVSLAQPGTKANFADGFIAKKTMPCTIIAQSYDGQFGIQPAGMDMVRTEVGGAYIVGANTAITIGHYAEGSSDGIMKGRWVHIHFTVFGGLDLLSLFHMPLTVPKETGDLFGAMTIELLSLPQASALERIARRNALAFRILEHVIAISKPTENASDVMRHSRTLTPALSFIRTNLHGRIEVKDIADAAGLSISHLHTLFRDAMHVPPMEYVKDLRLTEARYRVATTVNSFAEIAQAVGFADQFHFSRTFKERFGISPSAYRKQFAASM